MTAPTPEYLRVLADDVQHTVDNGYEFAPENVVAALRAAADQLESVRSLDPYGANALVKQVANEWFDEHAPAGVSMDDLNLLVHMITERLATR